MSKQDKPDKPPTSIFAKIKESPLFKILSGPAVGRTIGIVAAVFGSIPGMVIGLTSIAIGATMDTIQVGKLRNVRKEYNLLTRYRNAKSTQDDVLKQNPKIADALASDLYHPNRENKKSLTEQHNTNTPGSGLKSWGKAIFKNSLDILRAVVDLVIRKDPTSLTQLMGVGSIGLSLKGISDEASKQKTQTQFKATLRQEINDQRRKPDSPGYDNLTELAQETRAQRIQAMALKQLVAKEGYKNASPNEIRAEFNKIKQVIEQKEKAVKDQRSVKGRIRFVFKNFVKAHNPFSKYADISNLSKMKLEELSPLAKNQTHGSSIKEKLVQKYGPPISVKDLSLLQKIKQKLSGSAHSTITKTDPNTAHTQKPHPTERIR